MSRTTFEPLPSHCQTIACLCGGRFSLGYDRGVPMAWHSMPECEGFIVIDSTEDAVAWSTRCRAAAGDHRSSRDEPS